jgi:hypothetical protein
VRLGWSSVRAAARTLLQRNCVRQTENVHAVSSGYICRYFLLIVLDQSSIILKGEPNYPNLLQCNCFLSREISDFCTVHTYGTSNYDI